MQVTVCAAQLITITAHALPPSIAIRLFLPNYLIICVRKMIKRSFVAANGLKMPYLIFKLNRLILEATLIQSGCFDE